MLYCTLSRLMLVLLWVTVPSLRPVFISNAYMYVHSTFARVGILVHILAKTRLNADTCMCFMYFTYHAYNIQVQARCVEKSSRFCQLGASGRACMSSSGVQPNTIGEPLIVLVVTPLTATVRDQLSGLLRRYPLSAFLVTSYANFTQILHSYFQSA